MSHLRPEDEPLWAEARPYLDVRNNDEHTLVAYGVAKALLSQLPEAEADVVLPAILLHDVGWKRIPPDLLLAAIGRNPTRRDLVFEHERHSVVIARDILNRHGVGRAVGRGVEQREAVLEDADALAAAGTLKVLLQELPVSQAARIAAQLTGRSRKELYELLAYKPGEQWNHPANRR